MLELIGILVVTWFAWNMAKVFIGAYARRTLQLSMHEAKRQGVPVEFAQEIIDSPEMLKRARRDTARKQPGFAELPAHQQYAQTIVNLYQADTILNELEDAAFERTKETVKSILQAQVAELKTANVPVRVGPITYAYVGALSVAASRNTSITLQQIRTVIEEVFTGEEHAFFVENAWRIALGSSDFLENMGAMAALAESEIHAGRGNYLVRFGKKVDNEQRNPPTERRDLSKVSKTWFLEGLEAVEAEDAQQ